MGPDNADIPGQTGQSTEASGMAPERLQRLELLLTQIDGARTMMGVWGLSYTNNFQESPSRSHFGSSTSHFSAGAAFTQLRTATSNL